MQPGRPLLATTVRPEGAAPLDMASGTGANASNPMSEARLQDQVAGLPLPRGVLGEGRELTKVYRRNNVRNLVILLREERVRLRPPRLSDWSLLSRKRRF